MAATYCPPGVFVHRVSAHTMPVRYFSIADEDDEEEYDDDEDEGRFGPCYDLRSHVPHVHAFAPARLLASEISEVRSMLCHTPQLD